MEPSTNVFLNEVVAATITDHEHHDDIHKQHIGSCLDDCKTCLFYQTKDDIIIALNAIENLTTSQEDNVLMNELWNMILKRTSSTNNNNCKKERIGIRNTFIAKRNITFTS